MGKKKYKNIKIPDPQVNTNSNLKFSFKYYDTLSSDYCISKWEEEDIVFAIKRLKDINTKKFKEVKGDKVYHFFPVYWEQTIKKDGFPIDEANNLPPFHFSLIGLNNQKARVYGAYANDTFYIVWFDFNHEIWPCTKKHT